MKLISFVTDGVSSYGVLEGTTVKDLGAVLRGRFPTLKALLGEDFLSIAQETEAPRLARSAVQLLPPVPDPAKILCIGKNYEEHRVETGGEKLAYPTIFTRFADTLVADGQDAWAPGVSSEIDFEGELAVVIGRAGRHIALEDALSHVAGYACFNDISIRDWQRHTTQFTPGKNFPRTGGFGPWIVTADEIADPQALDLTTWLNGDEVQKANTAEMIFNIRALIHYCSSFTQLSPGDVIATGTPGGVGAKRKPQLFMKVGDVVEIEIASVGTLRNSIGEGKA
ncbi:2-keto-4-pentenoate hydratase/2-oxohepta-3-ene-1,7-dioic acid hydratase (catechol pathway) [Granulicella pectinivorans]|jgi:2-keto-4-pentenoate hydratase/2-oxohepta-3-ene-1,7-dioic acid hydratase in catechol pathway|uniref:2-keto-4-pentenoate hydratase/2-oxohepta-3-ene-1,7-dioic acid hydratase (Catechol pathway) n=1 Tax=Granulicella pectinivorans TaxID=474950 RepID=A0A1I6L895_9BACT|nr:fumarylacetoacetate hydrolase family protein [Granulicella pectinivorans]SFR99644.1 2-keto-4-pentenoate hydratase/2-oxohepta-3-ene-1,7-dioic acid hydratase (catechol pathway) [Granulicella pectinivorans]